MNMSRMTQAALQRKDSWTFQGESKQNSQKDIANSKQILSIAPEKKSIEMLSKTCAALKTNPQQIPIIFQATLQRKIVWKFQGEPPTELKRINGKFQAVP